MYKQVEINGFRGFSDNQTLILAQPTGSLGSGLTVIVGANNAGKSTVIESIRSFMGETPSFSTDRRNVVAGDLVHMRLHSDGAVFDIKSIEAGTSETIRTPAEKPQGLFALPSRRVFAPYFGKSESDRNTFSNQIGNTNLRANAIDAFAYRLFKIAKTLENKKAFNDVLKKVLDPVPTWTIDQHATGQYFLKMSKGTTSHTSEGLGEGLVSLLFIIDALYDSEPGNCIVIDEPELSLHPALQRKLTQLLVEYSRDRQIIIATHSPYFLNLDALKEGATVARVYLSGDKSQISQLSTPTAKEIGKFLTDANNPHVLGLNAQETFFLEDRVILVEGQEDVIFYPAVQASLGVVLKGNFFGWGVGGAEKMKLIARVLKELGFKKVVGILDGNKASLKAELEKEFAEYRFFCIPADDVRSKTAVKEKVAVEGLLDHSNETVRQEHVKAAKKVFEEANEFLIG